MRQFKKWIIRILAGSTLFLLLVGLALFIAGIWFADEVKQLAIRELNRQLTTEVKVEGNISFSLFRHFPSAALTFEKVTIKESLPEKQDLLYADEISLLFNLVKILRQSYIIEKTITSEGQLTIRVDPQGNSNFQIFKTAETDGKDFRLQLEQSIFRNFKLRYLDEASNQHYSFNLHEATLSGAFSSRNFEMELESRFRSDSLLSSGLRLLTGRDVQISGNITCHLDSGYYEFENVIADVEGTRFAMKGNLTAYPSEKKLDLEVSTASASLEELIHLLPENYSKQLEHLSIGGDATVKGRISGILSSSANPAIRIDFSVANGMISKDGRHLSLEKISMDGYFHNGTAQNLQTSEVVISAFRLHHQSNSASGMMSVKNLKAPYLRCRVDGTINLSSVQELLGDRFVSEMAGLVHLHQCFYNGPLHSWSVESLVKEGDAGGELQMENISLHTAARRYEGIAGQVRFSGNELLISSFSLAAGGSDLRLTGKVSNFLPFFISTLNKQPQRQKLGVDLQFHSSHLNWEELLGMDSGINAESGYDEYSLPVFLYLLAGSVKGSVSHFTYRQFQAQQITGQVLFMPGTIYFKDLSLKAEKGTITSQGSLDISSPKHSMLQLTTRLDQLDIHQLFREFGDFDQQAITHEHLKGTVTADIALRSTWDDLKLNREKLYAVADITIRNGELNYFPPMMALAGFVKVSELKNIRFSELQNELEIIQGVVHVPLMKIFSNALNVQLSGTHSFQNIIDYRVQLNLLRLLTDKFRREDLQADAADQTTEGLLNLYLRMTGPAADPEIRYDRDAVKQEIARDLALEKQTLKDVLKKEFKSGSPPAGPVPVLPQEPAYFSFGDSLETRKEPAAPIKQKPADGSNPIQDLKKLFGRKAPED